MGFYFMHIIFCICIAAILTCTTSLLIHDEECAALFQFKQNFLHQDADLFNSWTKITNNTSNNTNGTTCNCCLWDGVVCNNNYKGCHVIELDLSESFLRGPISSNSSLFKLVHLQMLNLSMNDFVGSRIPSEIARLKQLRSLDLSQSNFSGQIPIEVSHLVSLSSLDLSWNSLKLQSPSLKNLVKNLTSLEELHLSGVDISSPIPRFLANFSSLKSIRFAGCQLRDEFPIDIFHLPKLKSLNVGNNRNLTGFLPEFRNNTLLETLVVQGTNFNGTIPESISNLKHLLLGGCFFSGNIPSSIVNMTQLEMLSLGNNELTGFLPSLVSLSELTVLDLSSNRFKMGRFPNWLSKLTNLNELYMSSLGIYGEIPPFLGNLTKLSFIELSRNSLSGHIPSSLMNLTQLRSLGIGSNQLQGIISSLFSNCKNLEYLRLNANNFSGIVELDTFVGLNKLTTLLLGGNRISFVETNNYTSDTLPALTNLGLLSCNLKKFPAFLRFKNKMTSLFLDGNKINGLVPVWIWNNSRETLQTMYIQDNFITGFQQHPHCLPWVRLESLYISNNKIRGRLPIPPKTTIVYDASNNSMIGEIPPVICGVKSLRLLDLSSNKMKGTLPPCFGNLSNSLFVLNLKRNNFRGTMMNAFAHGSLMKTIDLSENQFHGSISKSLANCINLEVLSLGDNYFDDIFPFWLGHLSELQVLILKSNKFHGKVQDLMTVGSVFPKLRIIDLSNNSFSGQLPNRFFQDWNSMKSVYDGKSSILQLEMSLSSFVRTTEWPFSMTLTNKGVTTEYTRILNIFTAIDLSSNNFEGEIPKSLQDLQGLESLNLSNNHLTGHILPSLGNLKNLESLDLSENELSGEIPKELLQLGFLAILNVSFNHLDGSIPQGKQFNTFDKNSYMGNPGLCGQPLSKDCQTSKTPTIPQTSNEYKSLLPNDIVDWVVIVSGVGSGLVIGIIFGNFVYNRYSDWFIERFGLRKDKWVRPLSNKRRNRIR